MALPASLSLSREKKSEQSISPTAAAAAERVFQTRLAFGAQTKIVI